MKALVSISFLLTSYPLLAGPISSGGGKAVVCYDADHQIIEASLLDLYEGKSVFHDVHLPPDIDIDDAIKLATTRLKKTAYNIFSGQPRISETIAMVRANSKLIPDDLKPIDDSAHVIVPLNCKIEQVAMFIDHENIVIVERIWDNMPPLQKAGLYLHEAVYWQDRLNGAQDSRRSRRVVSKALGNSWSFDDYSEGVPDTGYTYCSTIDANLKTVFFVYEEHGFQILHFLMLNGDLMISKAFEAFPIVAAFPFEDPSDINVSYHAGGEVNSKYEAKTKLEFNRSLEFDKNNKAWSRLSFSGQKLSYPAKSFGQTDLFCRHSSGGHG